MNNRLRKRSNRLSGRNRKAGSSLLLPLLSTIVGFIVDDLMKPDSRIKSLAAGLFPGRQIDQDKKNKILSADFEVIQDQKE